MANLNDSKHPNLVYICNYREKGRYDLALKELELLLKDNPKNETILIELGKTYKMMNKYPEALKEFIKAVKINPNNGEVLRELGETYRMSNKCDSAIKTFTEIIEITLANDHAYIELSKIYQKISSYDLAIEQLKKALQINPYNTGSYVGLGQIYKCKGENENAIEKFKEALKIDPNNKDVHVELGKTYQEQKRYHAAVNEFKTATDICPLGQALRFNLVQVYTQMGETDLSTKEAERILQLTPNEPFLQDSMLNEIEFLQRRTFLKSKVKSLQVTLTTKCNLKCRMCGIWNASPWDIPKKTVDEVVNLFPYLERIGWMGGEVFLYQYFEELFQKASAFPHLRQQIITNGVILTEEWIKKLVQSDNVELTISIDGVTKDVYEYIRRGANFEKLLTNLKLISELRQKYHSKIMTILNTVILKSNYHQIEQFVDFAKEHNFDQMSLMAVHFDLTPEENIFYTHKDSKIFAYIAERIPKIREKANAFGIRLDILLPREDLNRDSSGGQNNVSSLQMGETLNCDTGEGQNNTSYSQKGEFSCKAPWKWMLVADGGTVLPTGSCLKPIGNIYDGTLDEIWNSEQMQIYRRKVLTNFIPDLCRLECLTRDKDFS